MDSGSTMKAKLSKYKQMDAIIYGTFKEAKHGTNKVGSKNDSTYGVLDEIKQLIKEERAKTDVNR